MDQEVWIRDTLEGMVDKFGQFPTHNPNALKKALAGRLFEELSFQHVKSLSPPFRLIKSPDETFRQFHKMYPSSLVIPDIFGPKGLELISVPDGLAYDTRWSVYPGHRGLCKVYEYTLVKPRYLTRYVQRKVKLFRKLRGTHTSMFVFATLSFVIPADYTVDSHIQIPKFAHVETVPVSTALIRHVINQYLQERRGI